jgi:kynurenine formamidase
MSSCIRFGAWVSFRTLHVENDCLWPDADQTSHRWPVHHILLSRGILISENVTGFGPIANQRVELVFLALNIEESDGAPALFSASARP